MAMLSPRTITPLVVVVVVVLLLLLVVVVLLLLLLLLVVVVAVQNLAWRGHRRHPMPRAHATHDVGEGSRQGRNEVAGDHRRRVRLCHGCCPVTTRPLRPSSYRLTHTHIDTHADPGSPSHGMPCVPADSDSRCMCVCARARVLQAITSQTQRRHQAGTRGAAGGTAAGRPVAGTTARGGRPRRCGARSSSQEGAAGTGST